MADVKEWPIYFRKNLIVGDLESEVGIVALWTPISSLVKLLDKQSYCLLGQLYSKEGINYIIRNILARPSIRHLVVCGQELSGSGDALVKFIEKGISDDYAVKDAEFAKIHKEIPKDALEMFRKSVAVRSNIGLVDPVEIQKIVSQYQTHHTTTFTESAIYPDAIPEAPNVYPSDSSVFKIRKKYIGEAWLEILKHIRLFGSERSTFYDNTCRELFNICAVITDEVPGQPKMFPYFRVTEKDIQNYYPQFMSGDRGTEVYTYGERLWNYKGINQVQDVMIAYLQKYPTDRAALAVTFDVVHDHTAERAPCMCLLQANLDKNVLHLTAYFRSHSIYSGWLLNAYGLRKVQGYVASKLRATVGNLTIISNCAHYYDNEYNEVNALIEKWGKRLDCCPDPRGNFVISISGKEIIAVHQSPQGQFLQEFRHDATVRHAGQKLFNQIVMALGVSQVSHAFDLGVQIERAEIAVKYGLEFRQDNPIHFFEHGLKPAYDIPEQNLHSDSK